MRRRTKKIEILEEGEVGEERVKGGEVVRELVERGGLLEKRVRGDRMRDGGRG